MVSIEHCKIPNLKFQNIFIELDEEDAIIEQNGLNDEIHYSEFCLNKINYGINDTVEVYTESSETKSFEMGYLKIDKIVYKNGKLVISPKWFYTQVCVQGYLVEQECKDILKLYRFKITI